MEKYILDTNIFFNMAAGINLGKKTEDVVKIVSLISKKLKQKKEGEIIMPPSAIEEFLTFFSDKNQKFIKDFLSSITIKSPDYGSFMISGLIFLKLIKEVRERNYRGLNIGEEEIKEAGRLMMGVVNLSKKEFEIKIGEIIKKFRQRYRQATRVGFLDSVVDLDLIVLAKQSNGFLVSTDEGVLRWARIFGVNELPPQVLIDRMRWLGYLPHQELKKKTNQ